MNRRLKRAATGRFQWLAGASPARLLAWLRHHRQVAASSLRRLVAEPIQTGMTVAVIAVALGLPTLLIQLEQLANQAVDRVDRSSDINVFFVDAANPSEVENFVARWRPDSRIDRIRLVSPDEGMREFEQYSGLGSVLQGFETNPLPWVARITPAQGLSERRADLQLLLSSLQDSPSVAEVQLDLQWLERLDAILDFLARFSISVGILLGLGVVLILGNTVRLTIENRRAEILVIKLVGGTDRYVARPLLYTGFWLGLLGGLLAGLIVGLVSLLLGGPLERLFYAYESAAALNLSAGTPLLKLAAMGALLGVLGAFVSVWQHLRDIEPK